MVSTFPYLRVQGGDLESRLHCWEKIFFTIKQSSQLWKKPLEMSPDQSWFLKSTAKYAFIKRRIVYIKRLRCVFSNKRSGVLHSRVENRSPGKLFLLVGVLRHDDHDGAREDADLWAMEFFSRGGRNSHRPKQWAVAYFEYNSHLKAHLRECGSACGPAMGQCSPAPIGIFLIIRTALVYCGIRSGLWVV